MDFPILFLDKLLDKPYGPFVLDEINRKMEKKYITNCKSIFLDGGPKDDIVMPAELLSSTTPSPNKLKRENNHIFMFIFYILLPSLFYFLGIKRAKKNSGGNATNSGVNATTSQSVDRNSLGNFFIPNKMKY